MSLAPATTHPSIVTTLTAEWRSTGLERYDTGPYEGRTADDVLAAIPNDPDGVLLALIRTAQAGSPLAGRTVLQALLGKLVRMAAADARLSVADLVGALWIRIANYPVARRPGKVAANLVLDSRKDVLAEQRGLRLVEHPETGEPPVATAGTVLDAAVELGVIDLRSRAILGSVYGDGLSSAAAAERHGTTATAIRWRCSRDVRRLAARRLDLLPEPA